MVRHARRCRATAALQFVLFQVATGAGSSDDDGIGSARLDPLQKLACQRGQLRGEAFAFTGAHRAAGPLDPAPLGVVAEQRDARRRATDISSKHDHVGTGSDGRRRLEHQPTINVIAVPMGTYHGQASCPSGWRKPSPAAANRAAKLVTSMMTTVAAAPRMTSFPITRRPAPDSM